MLFVYGGAFNPPTKAHFEIIKLLLERFKPDEFYILPVGPHYNKPGVANFDDRYNMCEIVARKLGVKVSSLENEPTYRGTYYALKDFQKKDQDVYFVMGADNFDYLDKWINALALVSEFKFIVLTRNGYDINQIYQSKFAQYHQNFVFVNYENTISSSLYRYSKDEAILLEEVNEYIQKNNLYEE